MEALLISEYALARIEVAAYGPVGVLPLIHDYPSFTEEQIRRAFQEEAGHVLQAILGGGFVHRQIAADHVRVLGYAGARDTVIAAEIGVRLMREDRGSPIGTSAF
jgi:hypothetical protein